MKLMLTACNISSTPIRISTALRRARTPYTPIPKRMLPSTRKSFMGIMAAPPPESPPREGGRRKEEEQRRCPSFFPLPSSSAPSSLALLTAGQDDCPDQGDGQHEGCDLERDGPRREQRVAYLFGGDYVDLVGSAREVGRRDSEDRRDHEYRGGEGGERGLLAVERALDVTHARKHHREEDEDRYGAAVDEHLDGRQELRGEEDEDAGDRD